MPSTFTQNLLLEKIATGEQNNTWGATLDTNFDKIDAGYGLVNVNSQVITSSVINVSVALPSKYNRFKWIMQGVSPSSQGQIILNYSFDGFATSVYQPVYGGFLSTDLGSSRYGAPFSAANFAPLTTLSAAGNEIFGSVEFETTGSKIGDINFIGATAATSGTYKTTGGCYCTTAGAPTHLLLGFSADGSNVGQVAITAGRFTLMAALI